MDPAAVALAQAVPATVGSAYVPGPMVFARGGSGGNINTWGSPGAAVIAGKVYTAGGNAGAVTSVTRIFDPVLRAWTGGATMPANRGAGNVLAWGGFMFYLNGEGPTAGTIVDTVYRYDPAANLWSTVGNTGQVMYRGAAALVGSRAYSFGGWTSSALTTHAPARWYDFATDTSGAASSHAREWPTLIPFAEGAILAVGGSTTSNAIATAANSLYDSTLNTWTAVANSPVSQERKMACGVAVPAMNGAYVYGGLMTTGTGYYRQDNLFWDRATNAWSVPNSILGQGHNIIHTSAFVWGVGPDGDLWIYGGDWTNTGGTAGTVTETKLFLQPAPGVAAQRAALIAYLASR
jgi:hypothetical protein